MEFKNTLNKFSKNIELKNSANWVQLLDQLLITYLQIYIRAKSFII